MATTMQQSRSRPVETSPMDYEALRLRHLVDMRSHIPTLVERFDWPAERLKADREARLRKLVTHAKAHSAWHRRPRPPPPDEVSIAGWVSPRWDVRCTITRSIERSQLIELVEIVVSTRSTDHRPQRTWSSGTE